MKKFIEKIKNKNILKGVISALPVFLFSFIFFAVPTEFAHAGNWFVDALITAADTIFGNFFRAFAWLISKIASLFPLLTGMILDVAIRFTIDGSNLQLSGIVQGWSILRDLVNMLFIFILMYVAIMTILQASSFQTKKILVNLIIMGVLMNFSYFITTFVIDIGNALAGIVYDAITPNNTSVGAILIDRLKLTFLENVSTNVAAYKIGIAHLMNAVAYTVAGFVFIAAAAMFIVRHIYLIILIILSPVAFAAYILPNTDRHFSKWLSMLISNTFVAPLFLLMIAITLAIASSGDLIQSSGATDLQFGASGQIESPLIDGTGIFMNYIIIIGMLIGSMVVSKSVAGGLMSSTAKFIGGATMAGAAGAGFLGRNIVGRRAQRTLDKKGDSLRAKRDDVNASFAEREKAKKQLNRLKSRAASSYDVRNTNVGKGTGALGGMTYGAGGMNVRAGRGTGKGGFAATEKKKRDELEKGHKAELDQIGDDQEGEARQSFKEDRRSGGRSLAVDRVDAKIAEARKEIEGLDEKEKSGSAGLVLADGTTSNDARRKELEATIKKSEERKKKYIERGRRAQADYGRKNPKLDTSEKRVEAKKNTFRKAYIDEHVRKRGFWQELWNESGPDGNVEFRPDRSERVGDKLEKYISKSKSERGMDEIMDILKDSGVSTEDSKKASEGIVNKITGSDDKK